MDAKELYVNKLLCEQSLLYFTRYFYKARFGSKFILNWHHEEIAKHLEMVHRGEIKNLIINIPPRYSKTEFVNNFIAWALAKNPACKFISLSYSDDLILDNSSKIKEMLSHEDYEMMWGVDLKQDSKSKRKWYTREGGGMYATAAGGAITGFGAGCADPDAEFGGAIIIDDPHKPDEIDSDLVRNRVNDRLNTTILSRRNSRNTPVIIIMQRLHEEDMTGYCLDGNTPEEWHHLKLPAISETGGALWPVKHNIEELRAMQGKSPYIFSGQYQQEPTPEEGVYFKREWFNRVGGKPDFAHYYGASDYAVSEGKGDYTVHVVVGVDSNDKLWLVDMWRGQTTPDIWIDKMLDMMEKWKTLAWGEEAGQIRKSLGPFIDKRMRERSVHGYRLQYTSVSDKPTRARSIQGRIASEGIYVPKDAPWVQDLLGEAIRFPLGKHDDMVDALSIIGRMLNGLKAGHIPKKDKEHIDTSAPTINDLLKMRKRMYSMQE